MNDLQGAAPRGPWWWVPSLYFAEGIPYVVVMTVAVIMFKRLGVGNTEIALYTSWLYLPYAIKPLWSPIVQGLGTRRSWIVFTQLLVGAGLACTALAISADDFVRYTLAGLTIVAVSSATHDVAADGFYLLAMNSHQQAWFVGIRSTAYRAAMIAGQGLLVMLAGTLEAMTGLPTVPIEVSAAQSESQPLAFDSAVLPPSVSEDQQRVLVSAGEIALSINGRGVTEAKDLLEKCREWNTSHEFYQVEESAASDATTDKEASWIVALEDAIRRWFGPRKTSGSVDNNRSGDLALVWMRLARPVPTGRQQVVQFGLAGGDTSFQVVEGERFTVTEQNWDQPFAAVVRVDEKLDRPSQATFEVRSGNLTLAWSATFFLVAAAFLMLCLYHSFALPRPASDRAHAIDSENDVVTGFMGPFIDFFRKPRILAILAFLLLYRLPESQLVKLATPFLLDGREVGGLAITTGEVGFVYGTVGVIMLTLGGIFGGFVAARDGLRAWLLPMALIIHLPNAAFLFLAYAQPENLWVTTAAVAIEQFGYGFGFTAYLLYCIYISRGNHETVHYALCTGCMALGMMIPGMWSGWLQELIGYQHFFIWIMVCAIPSIAVTLLVDVDPAFGKKEADLRAEGEVE